MADNEAIRVEAEDVEITQEMEDELNSMGKGKEEE